jgi:hypothetical protein
MASREKRNALSVLMEIPHDYRFGCDVRRHERPGCARGRQVCAENKRVGVFLRDAFERIRHIYFYAAEPGCLDLATGSDQIEQYRHTVLGHAEVRPGSRSAPSRSGQP